jgi:flagellar biosynthesis protein FlhF
MNIQRFHAPTAREALALARAAFGDDTLILSNRQVGDGVEVMAATEQGLAPAAPDAAFAPAAPAAPATKPEAGRGASQPLPYALVATSGASTEEVVKADVEQLAMSTLSFQDYVRERMLRRQTEAAAPTPTAPPHAPLPASQPSVQSAAPAPAIALASPAASWSARRPSRAPRSRHRARPRPPSAPTRRAC